MLGLSGLPAQTTLTQQLKEHLVAWEAPCGGRASVMLFAHNPEQSPVDLEKCDQTMI